MKEGSKACPFCGSRFTFEAFELVDSKRADQPCGGCVHLYAILAESARLKAAMPAPEAPAGMVDLSSLEAITARLNAGRSMPSPVFDARKAQANDA